MDLIINATFWIGAAIGALASIFLLDTGWFPANLGWRLAFAIGASLGLAILLVRRHVPETPRWLPTPGRQEGLSSSSSPPPRPAPPISPSVRFFPLEIRTLAIAVFFALGTLIGGVGAPALFSRLIATGSRDILFRGYAAASALMITAADVELRLGVAAERQPLENLQKQPT